jgi:soluble lytic murein transglycosylase-like protein
MVTIVRVPGPNKSVYNCFSLALGLLLVLALGSIMLAASPTSAAERSSAVPAVLTAEGRVSVVRVDRRTGKLVRTVRPLSGAQFTESELSGEGRPASAAPARSLTVPHIAPPPPHIQELIEKSARAYHVDPLLVESVIQAESNYNHYAVSKRGAEGLMQLMPSTARMLGVSNSFDPAQNIDAGVRYLKYLQDVYQDDRLALAAYNAGQKAVDKYKWIPPYAETQSYVELIGRRYEAARQAREPESAQTAPAGMAAQQASDSAEPEERHPRLEQSLDENGRLVLRTAQ